MNRYRVVDESGVVYLAFNISYKKGESKQVKGEAVSNHFSILEKISCCWMAIWSLGRIPSSHPTYTWYLLSAIFILLYRLIAKKLFCDWKNKTPSSLRNGVASFNVIKITLVEKNVLSHKNYNTVINVKKEKPCQKKHLVLLSRKVN